MAVNKLVVGLVGMPGAGKSVITEVARRMGFDVIVMGDVVREEAKKKNLECTPENLGKIMIELRLQEGKNVIAKKCVPKIMGSQKDKVIVDGIRSTAEIEEFVRHFPKFTLIAVKASPETRFKRLYHRKRGDDPKNWEIFHERDLRELSVGLGEAMARAEYVIENEGTLKATKQQTAEILRRIEDKWMK
ncbi:MAG: AAA family ATPase [Candidatus Bathyarchaeia archaeon]|nr:MAG: dephospho-CoA kinase [Candidatus Bathyarchaeota archaeon]